MSILLSMLLWTISATGQQVEPGAKTMFYNPGGADIQTAATFLPDTPHRLREVNFLMPLKHCGIHYWFENDKGLALP